MATTTAFRTRWCAAAGFEAARRLDERAAGRREGRLHGHSFRAEVLCDLPAGWARHPGGEVAQLHEVLQAAVAPLDYQLLNDRLAQPDDAGLARWLAARLAPLPVGQLSLRSAPQHGIDLAVDRGGTQRVRGWRRYAFQSAHRLPHVPAGHKCGRLHGHGFEVVLAAWQDGAGDADGRSGHERLDALWAPLQAELDHACLNDLPGLENPTSEVLAAWIWQRLQPHAPSLSDVTVYETPSCAARFDGRRYRIEKQLRFDSALRLRRAPEGSSLRRVHGHTYTLRLQLAAPLDEVMGWVMDFGDVTRLFAPLFDALDHRPLHEIEDLADCDSASLAAWILREARTRVPQFDRVQLHETAGCGAVVDVVEVARRDA